MSRPSLGQVLVIEDDFLIATDIGHELSQLGASEIVVASSVDQARSLLSSDEIDLATVDVSLAGGNCRQIVEALEERGIPWIYISGYLEVDFGGLPPAPWLSKPVSSEALATAIASISQRRPVMEGSM